MTKGSGRMTSREWWPPLIIIINFLFLFLVAFRLLFKEGRRRKNFWLLGESEGLCLEMVAYTFKRPRPDRVLVRRRNNNHLNNTVAPVGIYTSPFWRRYIYI